MATPIKDVEDAFWDWLPTAVTLPATLKIKRSHLGESLAFAADDKAFQDPAQMPAMWLVPTEAESEFAGQNAVIYRFRFEGGLAMNVPADARARDTFEALVAAIQRAIHGRMIAEVPTVHVHELDRERLVVHKASFAGAVLGYVWTFRLTMGQVTVHFP